MGKHSSSKCLQITCYLPMILMLGAAMALPMSNIGNTNAVQSTDKIIIPAMARKAGGRLRPELVKDASTSPPTPEETPPPTNDVKPDDGRQSDDDYNYDDWFDESSSEELDCSEEMYYHQLGRQCVPIRCPGGNKRRNPMTGDCVYYYDLYRSYNNHGRIPNNSHSRTSPYVYRTPITRHQGRKIMKG